MTTTEARPPLARKHTRTTIAKQDAQLDQTVEVLIDGESYKLTPADLTGIHEMRIRKETGLSVSEILTKLQESPGIDLLGMFMFACAIAAGDNPDLMEILGGISYASEVEIADAEPAPPEA